MQLGGRPVEPLGVGQDEMSEAVMHQEGGRQIPTDGRHLGATAVQPGMKAEGAGCCWASRLEGRLPCSRVHGPVSHAEDSAPISLFSRVQLLVLFLCRVQDPTAAASAPNAASAPTSTSPSPAAPSQPSTSSSAASDAGSRRSSGSGTGGGPGDGGPNSATSILCKCWLGESRTGRSWEPL